jgi:hypothetical protein
MYFTTTLYLSSRLHGCEITVLVSRLCLKDCPMSSGSHKDTLGVTKVVYSVRVADPMVRTRQREATVLPTGLELRLQLNLDSS